MTVKNALANFFGGLMSATRMLQGGAAGASSSAQLAHPAAQGASSQSTYAGDTSKADPNSPQQFFEDNAPAGLQVLFANMPEADKAKFLSDFKNETLNNGKFCDAKRTSHFSVAGLEKLSGPDATAAMNQIMGSLKQGIPIKDQSTVSASLLMNLAG